MNQYPNDPNLTIHTDPGALEAAFYSLTPPCVPHEPDERLLSAVPRSAEAWRLPRNQRGRGIVVGDDTPILLPMETPPADICDSVANDSRGIYLNVLPNPLIMHTKVGRYLEEWAARLMAARTTEHTLAQDAYGVPMLIGRFDAAMRNDGTLGIYELDDVCSLWGWNSEINPLAEIGCMDMEDQLAADGHPLYLAELFERDDGVDSDVGDMYMIARHTGQAYPAFRQRAYAHCDSLPRMSLSSGIYQRGEVPYDSQASLLFRGRKQAKHFEYYAGKLAAQAITPMMTRDEKLYLARAGLGVAAANVDVALEAGRRIIAENNDHQYVVIKTEGARTEGTAILAGGGTKERGTYSSTQVMRKLGALGAQPCIVQPFYRPPTMAELGLTFSAQDSEVIQSVEHRGHDAGKYTVPGQEHRFSAILRTFVVYNTREKRLMHIGGQWAATPGLIVHGAANSVAGPLYDAGYKPQMQPFHRSAELALDMLATHSAA